MSDSDTDIQFGRFIFKMLGSFRFIKQYPLVFIAKIAFGVDMFFFTAEMFRQFLADGNLLLVFPD